MGNFYGNITDTNRVQFYFDKFYSTKKSLQEHSLQDGIYIGRYVLVEYNLNPFEDDKLINLNTSALIPQEKCIAYKNENDNIVLILYEAGKEINRHSIKALTAEEEKNEDLKSEFNHKINYWIDNLFYPNNPIQGGDPGVLRGWDSTVWQKVFIDASKKNVNYINIAELNALVPKFEIVYSLPGENIKPHVDVPISSLLDYKIRTSTNWNLIIDNNKDILFNELGFEEKNRNYDTSNNSIEFIKESSGKNVFSIEGSQELISGEDTQRLKINLPAIGNAVAKVWDLIYGYDNEKTRKDLSSWEQEKNNPNKEGFYLDNNTAHYNPNELNSINGCLKTFYNLFGYNIINISNLPDTKNINKNEYNKNIYFLENDKKYYYLTSLGFDDNQNEIYKWNEIQLYSLIEIILEFNQLLGANDQSNMDGNTIHGAINLANKATINANEAAFNANTAMLAANKATISANEATKAAYGAQQAANKATIDANEATKAAYGAQQVANKATIDANEATKTAYEAVKVVNTSITSANEIIKETTIAKNETIKATIVANNTTENMQELIGVNTPDNRDPNTVHGCLNIAKNAQHDYTQIVEHATTLIGQPTDQTFDTLEGAQNLAEKAIKDAQDAAKLANEAAKTAKIYWEQF